MRRPTRRRHLWPPLLLMLFLALAIAGCGGQGGDLNTNGSKALVKWGRPAGGSPKGVVMLIHGGGWQPNRNAYESEMPTAAQFQRFGYATVVIGYDAGARGFQQIKQVYSEARRRYPGLPICAHGISAGGNLALMLAVREPTLTCVLGIATPTDLTTLKDQGGREAYDLAVKAFGQDQLGNWSPVRYANRIKAKVLLLGGQNDSVVPIEQSREFVRARPETQLLVLPPGSAPVVWLHGATASPQAVRSAVTRGFSFIAQALNGA